MTTQDTDFSAVFDAPEVADYSPEDEAALVTKKELPVLTNLYGHLVLVAWPPTDITGEGDAKEVSLLIKDMDWVDGDSVPRGSVDPTAVPNGRAPLTGTYTLGTRNLGFYEIMRRKYGDDTNGQKRSVYATVTGSGKQPRLRLLYQDKVEKAMENKRNGNVGTVSTEEQQQSRGRRGRNGQ